MKKILLINPGQEEGHYIHTSYRIIHRDPPPVALLYIGTYLSENGYDVKIIDAHIERNYAELISKEIGENEHLFVGLTIIIGQFLKNASEIMRLIREVNPKVPIVWGGIMASIATEECLRQYKPDFIVRYEGEETTLELAKALEYNLDVNSIEGISYLKNNQIFHNPARMPKRNLDEYPIPKWELLGKNFNKNQDPYFFLIMTSKGCIFNCKFCYKHSIDDAFRNKTPPWRYRTSQHVIKELEYIHQKTSTRVFTFGDDNFLVNKKRALEIFDYIWKNNFYIEECVGHINNLDDELIDAMAGIVQLFIFSVETASIRLQKLIDKKVDLHIIPSKVKKLYEKGIVCSISFIIGLPTEEEEDLRKNIELMLKLKDIHPFCRGNIYLFLPLIKTELFNITEKIYNVKLPANVIDLEDANLWVKCIDDPIGKKFRPWLSDEQFKFLVLYGNVFNDVFHQNNRVFSDTTKEILQNNLKIKKIFKGIENVNHPKTDYRPYVLNRVLSGEKINLVNDIKNK